MVLGHSINKNKEKAHWTWQRQKDYILGANDFINFLLENPDYMDLNKFKGEDIDKEQILREFMESVKISDASILSLCV